MTTYPLSASEVNVRQFIHKVYAWMSAGLAVTGACAWYMFSDPRMIVNLVHTPFLFYGLMIGEFILVVALSGWVQRMDAGTAKFAFLFYSAINGVTLSVLFLVYTQASIANAFFMTAGLFGVMSLYGFTTQTDLTSMGNLCFMALLGVILASLVNIWTHSPAVQWAVNYLSILIFVGLTAYDTQRIKALNQFGREGTDEETKGAILGALTLYLDFINLFISLLRVTGKRRD